MLSTFKKFSAAFLPLLFFAAPLRVWGGGASLFSAMYSDANFFSNADVMAAYAGAWSGTQTVKFGDISVRGKIDITYAPSVSEGGARLVGVGKVVSETGASAPTSCYMYECGGTLVLEMRDDGGVIFYKAVIDAKSVIWIPLYSFFAYDFQQDFFYTEKGKTYITSRGAREFTNRGNRGILRILTKFEKLESAYPADRVNTSSKRDIKVEAAGGVKFGE